MTINYAAQHVTPMKPLKAIQEAVQIYREAVNLMPSLYTHLSALDNISSQKSVIMGAARRYQSCFNHNSTTSHVDKEATSDDGGHDAGLCDHFTTPVATTSLGILTTFTSSTTAACSTVELLIAQHTTDQSDLLASIARISLQSWKQTLNRLTKIIEAMEKETDKAIHGNCVSYGSPSWEDATGLPGASQVQWGLYGLAAALTQMGSLLQEVVLALRTDMMQSCFAAGGDEAASPAEYLSGVLRREAAAVITATAPLLPMDTIAEKSNDKKHQQPPSGLRNFAKQSLCFTSLQPLRLGEAVAQLRPFLEERWNHCKEVYFVDESWILLAHAS